MEDIRARMFRYLDAHLEDEIKLKIEKAGGETLLYPVIRVLANWVYKERQSFEKPDKKSNDRLEEFLKDLKDLDKI